MLLRELILRCQGKWDFPIKEAETWREYVEKLPQSEREALFK